MNKKTIITTMLAHPYIICFLLHAPTHIVSMFNELNFVICCTLDEVKYEKSRDTIKRCLLH